MFPISILDLVRVREGGSVRLSLDQSRAVAAHVERLGYTRLWVAEHHNMVGVASAATAVALSHIAADTSTIRIGAGGIMLPNHSPLVIAEQFGTLEALFPGRIDLGLGRAPGTDQIAAQAMRVDYARANAFPSDVLQLQALLGPSQPGQRLVATPGENSRVPLWILGSSTFGAQLAAQLGLPYAFASHFAPDALDSAMAIYRRDFTPSEQAARPYAMAGLNVIAAATDAEARRLATTQQVGFVRMLRGERGLSQPPVDDIDSFWSPMEKAHVTRMLSCSVVGSLETVRAGMAAFIARTGVDELMIVSDVFDHEKRLQSLEIIAEAARGLPVLSRQAEIA